MSSKTPKKNGQAFSLLIHGKVSDFMTSPPIMLTKEDIMEEAKTIMRDNNFSSIPIDDGDGHLIGLVSVQTIIHALENGLMDDIIEKHMVTDVVYLEKNMNISTVMTYLKSYTYGRYPVVDSENKLVGVVTKGDLMMFFYKRLGSIYMHNKRRDDALDSFMYANLDDYLEKAISPETIMDEHSFSYFINTTNIEEAGTGSTLFKKFLEERNFPQEAVRRASISVYEAEVNVVIHGEGKGYIRAYMAEDHLVVSIDDSGPGIDNIEQAMQPGYTTASDRIREQGFGAGMGLDNIQKYADNLAIISSEMGLKVEINIIPKKKETN